MFDQKENKIRIATAYEVKPQAMHIESNSQMATVAVGVILFLGALFAILGLLK